jgi:DNA-nicking Smr family endonuclease
MSGMRKPVSLPRQTSTQSEPTDDDRRLFREAVGPVTPVRSDKVQPHTTRPKPFPKRHDREPVWPQSPSTDVPLLTTGDIVSYVSSGMQQGILRRLRQARFDIDAEVDLHGHTVHQAKIQLERFLRICLQDACRCVLVIHGKGYRSEGDRPILKNKINLWLRQHPQVLAFCTSRPMHGGTGAVYVLLRGRSRHGDYG